LELQRGALPVGGSVRLFARRSAQLRRVPRGLKFGGWFWQVERVKKAGGVCADYPVATVGGAAAVGSGAKPQRAAAEKVAIFGKMQFGLLSFPRDSLSLGS